jgi:lipocalin
LYSEDHYKKESTNGSGYVSDPSAPNKLTIQLNGSPPANYDIVSSDYKSYALIYSCSQFGSTKFEFAFVLSRTKELGQDVITHLESLLNPDLRKRMIDVKQVCDN